MGKAVTVAELRSEPLSLFSVGEDPVFDLGSLDEANSLLGWAHYLGPVTNGGAKLVIVQRLDRRIVGCQVWRHPTARWLPSDGTWLELSRWCLTNEGGKNAGSRMHRFAVRTIRAQFATAETLVSYSDPSAGHTGALYRSCNWLWAPTWHRLSPPPTGNGSWGAGVYQHVKDRWVFALRGRPDRLLAELGAPEP